MSKRIRELEIEPCCGITDRPENLPQTWDAESLWEKSLTGSFEDGHNYNADEVDSYDLIVG